MISKCKTCGHEEKYHKGNDVIKHGGRGARKRTCDFKKCRCEKFQAEDETQITQDDEGIMMYKEKQKKGCGKDHPILDRLRRMGYPYSCPSCENQSRPLRRSDKPEEKSHGKVISPPSGTQSPPIQYADHAGTSYPYPPQSPQRVTRRKAHKQELGEEMSEGTFNLSDKAIYTFGSTDTHAFGGIAYKTEDVQEFIRRLKEELSPKKYKYPLNELLRKEIDKLAGNKLLEGGKK